MFTKNMKKRNAAVSGFLGFAAVAVIFGILVFSLGACKQVAGKTPNSRKAAVPVAYPPGGSYSSAQNVTLESATDGAVIYYTTNGTPPATSSAMYSSPINLSTNTLLRAIAVKGGIENSDVMTENYSITLPAGIEKTATPVAVPPAGTYSGNQLVTLSSATEGAVIYYTTDGSTPTVNSTLYSGTIDVSSAATNLMAVAVKEGMNSSDIMTAIYNITNVNVALPLSHIMAEIPAGTFTMGSPTTEPNHRTEETQHQVTLSAFKMGVYQVTQELYQAVMGTNPSYFSSSPAAGEVQGRRPVECVSWYDAVGFCNKLSIMEGLSPAYSINGSTDPAEWDVGLVAFMPSSTGYRLPTEAQWEYACRAGTTTAYNTGASLSDSTGWHYANSDNKTHEVGKKPANAWGLYDMHGNVKEWCWDWYWTYPNTAATDPVGPSSGSLRVLRGGSWFDNAYFARSAFRIFNYPSLDYPGNRVDTIGFRLVCP